MRFMCHTTCQICNCICCLEVSVFCCVEVPSVSSASDRSPIGSPALLSLWLCLSGGHCRLASPPAAVAALCRLPWGWGTHRAHPANEAATGPLSSSVSTEWLLAPWLCWGLWPGTCGHCLLCQRALADLAAQCLWLSGQVSGAGGGHSVPQGVGAHQPYAACSILVICGTR